MARDKDEGRFRAGVIGGSGYAGGEVLRLLLGHPDIQLVQAISRTQAGRFIYQVHPNLRKQSSLKFEAGDSLKDVDILFLALPHGLAQRNIQAYQEKAPYLVDLSADFRLRDSETYAEWYGEQHAAPDLLPMFTYGLPELHWKDLKHARMASGVGCNAAASILSLYPLVTADLLEPGEPVIVEIKVGSSEAGSSGNPGSHHPERANVVRTFSAFGHRHTAEVIQELGLTQVILTMTAVDLVRGALATAHATVRQGVTQKDLWAAYRDVVERNVFLRLVKEQRGVHRVPEPKILAGSNYADLGFELNQETGHVVSICALDNLMKGAAGSAVQAANLMLGLDETAGLEFPGLHPA
jgi:N-acetyl-gamma-glutamyl-phosphate/LysW-gamma-L-alpha-aminoadipyl-6-phosphate reductase